MASPLPAPSLVFARVSALLLVAGLVLIWAVAFKTSFTPPPPSSQEQFIYAVLHPLVMVIGFIIISGEGSLSEKEGHIREKWALILCKNFVFVKFLKSITDLFWWGFAKTAILVHRWLPGSMNMKKTVHLGMQGVALASGIFGIWTKFQGKDGIVANFYSLHSWMGLICILLFALQWIMGFLSFWHRGEVRRIRLTVLPWHVFLGLYTYGLAVATAETGLLEKLTFIQTSRNISRNGSESMVVNGLGLGLALLSGIVILAAVSPRYQQGQIHQTKPLYSHVKY